MIVALISSTNALLRRAFLPMPLSIIVLWASTEVKRSSYSSIGIFGKPCAIFQQTERHAHGSHSAHRSSASVHLLQSAQLLHGLRKMIKRNKAEVSTVANPLGMICNGSVTANPVRFFP